MIELIVSGDFAPAPQAEGVAMGQTARISCVIVVDF